MKVAETVIALDAGQLPERATNLPIAGTDTYSLKATLARGDLRDTLLEVMTWKAATLIGIAIALLYSAAVFLESLTPILSTMVGFNENLTLKTIADGAAAQTWPRFAQSLRPGDAVFILMLLFGLYYSVNWRSQSKGITWLSMGFFAAQGVVFLWGWLLGVGALLTIAGGLDQERLGEHWLRSGVQAIWVLFSFAMLGRIAVTIWRRKLHQSTAGV